MFFARRFFLRWAIAIADPINAAKSVAPPAYSHMPAGMWLYAGGATLLAAFIGSAIAIAQRKKKRRAKNISRIDSADKADNGGDV